MVLLNIHADNVTGPVDSVTISLEEIACIEWGTPHFSIEEDKEISANVIHLRSGDSFVFSMHSDSGKALAEWFSRGSLRTSATLEIVNITEDYVGRQLASNKHES